MALRKSITEQEFNSLLKITDNEELLQHLSPLGWEHIHLTGDYVWNNQINLKKGEFRPLRKV